MAPKTVVFRASKKTLDILASLPWGTRARALETLIQTYKNDLRSFAA